MQEQRKTASTVLQAKSNTVSVIGSDYPHYAGAGTRLGSTKSRWDAVDSTLKLCQLSWDLKSLQNK